MSCHFAFVTVNYADGLSADPRPLSRVMHNRLAPDWSIHAMMLSIHQIPGLPRFLSPSTWPVITLASMLSSGILITCSKYRRFLDLM